MTSYFCITVRFLQPYSHGRGDGGEPEWPPSPLRLFQALVAAAAGRWNERLRVEYAAPALRWLESREAVIVAPHGEPTENPYRLYVPDNVTDKVAASWRRGNTAGIEDYRTEKDVWPVQLHGEAVHYLFPTDADFERHRETLTATIRSVTQLGWGIDTVVADAKELSGTEADALPGHRWRPVPAGGTSFRIPVAGTLEDLTRKHGESLDRFAKSRFDPVAEFAKFKTVNYASATVPGANLAAPRPWCAFSILTPDTSRFCTYATARRLCEVAGMVRNAAGRSAEARGQSPDRINAYIHGHGPAKEGQATSDNRLMFLPLPSILQYKEDEKWVVKVGAIRRVLVAGPPGSSIREVVQLLAGAELIPEGKEESEGILSSLPQSDRHISANYTDVGSVWSTVTPVLLPGYDDPKHLRRKLRGNEDPKVQHRYLKKLDERTHDLLVKAFVQAGFARDLMEQCELRWQRGGFRVGTDLVTAYRRPENLKKFPAYHVRVVFPAKVPGPLAVGAGRYRGFGLFAAER